MPPARAATTGESLIALATDVGQLKGEMKGSREWRSNMERQVTEAHDAFNVKLDELHDCVERRVDESHKKLSDQLAEVGKTVDRLDKTVAPLAAENVQHKWNTERRRRLIMRVPVWLATILGLALGGLLTALFTGWLHRFGWSL